MTGRQTEEFKPAYMGEFLKDYEPPIVSLNQTINFFLTRPVKFTDVISSAIVTQEVEFPDVSFYQKEIDYEIMAQNTDAIVIRAGQNIWADEQFERNYAEAKRKNLKVGVYWFYDGRVSPRLQAELLISLLWGKSIDLEVFIDWERNYGGPHEGLQNVVAMMEIVELAGSAGLQIKGVGLYTGYYFFRANSNPITNASQYNYLKARPLWLGWYTIFPSNVLIPAPWSTLTIWQWGTPQYDYGQQTEEIDMNWFNGTRQEFALRYGEVTGPTDPTDPGEPMEYIKLTSNNPNDWRRIRDQVNYPTIPHIAGLGIGTIEIGSFAKALPAEKYVYTQNVRATIGGVVYEAFAGDTWWKVYESNGSPISGWVAEIHKGSRYLNTELVTDEPQPSGHLIQVYVDGELVFEKTLD